MFGCLGFFARSALECGASSRRFHPMLQYRKPLALAEREESGARTRRTPRQTAFAVTF
jgi:hypothetical protein